MVFDDNCRCYQMKCRVDYLFPFLCGWCWSSDWKEGTTLFLSDGWFYILMSYIRGTFSGWSPLMLNAQWCLYLDSGAIKSSIYWVENIKSKYFYLHYSNSFISNVWLQLKYIFICQSDSCIAHIFLHWHGGMWMDNVYKSKCVHITISVQKRRAVKNWGRNIILFVCELDLIDGELKEWSVFDFSEILNLALLSIISIMKPDRAVQVFLNRLEKFLDIQDWSKFIHIFGILGSVFEMDCIF